MSEHDIVQAPQALQGLALQKFEHPDWTAGGEPRASIALTRLETLWINTGTLCNITCHHCYIESSPSNDRLAYITRAEAVAYYDEIAAGSWGTREIGLTGGEPFMNPEILGLIEDALARGFEVLVLTNAMQPMRRPRIGARLIELNKRFVGRLTLRVSLDHHAPALHETERGEGSWAKAVAGLDWLAASGFKLAIGARTCWHESETDA
ncbi:MAG TPA: radical SAM protein, partial [Hyphomicrobiaceae bacterium]|nr:radical SAM protein [Hyphomicrobiaceae bacterium]